MELISIQQPIPGDLIQYCEKSKFHSKVFRVLALVVNEKEMLVLSSNLFTWEPGTRYKIKHANQKRWFVI